MNKSLLITIAYHHEPGRLVYLKMLFDNFCSYQCSFDIIIDTNTTSWCNDFPIASLFNTKIIEHNNLSHPFHLTWIHRRHIKDNIDKYDVLMYLESDMYVPFENYLNYLESFKLLWPTCVPSFVRIERKDGVDYISDAPEKLRLSELNKASVNLRNFASLRFPFSYNAFWIMPAKQLKEIMPADFVRYTDGREYAAMFVGWELGKNPMVEIVEENGRPVVSEKCYSYHLPNNYALSEGSPNGKIKIKELFI